jgi:hypothetical protein
MVLALTIAAGPRECSHSQVRVLRGSWPHFTGSYSGLPQPGWPGTRIYIPQEQSGPVIPPGTRFPFRPLLRLAELRWRYSNPPPYRISHLTSLYSPGTDHTENVSSIIACSLVAGETKCPQSCSLATASVLSPVYTVVAWQQVYVSQYECVTEV